MKRLPLITGMLFVTLQVMAQCNFSISIQTDSVRCFGESNGGASVTISGGTGPFFYTWNVNPPQTTSVPTISGLPAGFYTVSVTDGLGCVMNRPFNIFQPANLIADVGFDTAVCADQPVGLRSLVFGGNPPFIYQWTCNLPSGNCYLDQSDIATPTIRPWESTVFYFQATDSKGCQTPNDSVVVQVYPLPEVYAGPDMHTYLSEPVQLLAMASQQGNFHWTPHDGLSDPYIAQPWASPEQPTTYRLVFTNEHGCTDTSFVNVEVTTDITIPTGLSPNGDGINDYWDVKNLVAYPDCEVEVFNRYGVRIFHSSGYEQPWDGDNQPTGTYYYVIHPGVPNAKPKTGFLTLIR